MTTTGTQTHHQFCRGRVFDSILQNVQDDQGAAASRALATEDDLAWGIRVGDLIDQYLIDGTATCGCDD